MPNVTAKDAVKAATEYYQFITNSFGIKLVPEEVELIRERGVWTVMLSFTDDPFGRNKEYKVFEINAETGDIISMKAYYPQV